MEAFTHLAASEALARQSRQPGECSEHLLRSDISGNDGESEVLEESLGEREGDKCPAG